MQSVREVERNAMPETISRTSPVAPTVRLIAGRYSAQIDLRSGGIAALSYDGAPLLESYDTAQLPPAAANSVLAPWPNRTEDGIFSWKGTEHQLAITEPERHNAIHGFVLDAAWQIVNHDPDRVEIAADIAPQQGWPWALRVTASYLLDEQGLHCTYGASTQEDSVPFAFGLHPYLSPQGTTVDEAELRLPPVEHHLLDARNVPTGEHAPVELSHCVAELELDDLFYVGPVPHTVELAADGRGVRMDSGEGLGWLQIYTAPDFPGRGRAIAVEPMSAPPNALRTGTDLVELGPDRPWQATVHFSVIE